MGQYTVRHDSVGSTDGLSRWAAEDEDLSKRFPALSEFLTEQVDEAGKVRVTSTLIISCEDGRWKVCLVDRAQQGSKWDYKLWASGVTLYAAMHAIDASIQEGSAEWRHFKKWEPPKGR